MPPVTLEKTSVCLICLKRFGVTAPSPDVPIKTESSLECPSEDPLADIPASDSPPKVDNYSRFLRFSERYLHLKINAQLLNLKQNLLKEGNDKNWRLETFCSNCEYVVSIICDLHGEIQERQLRLLWRLSQLGDTLKAATTKVSHKLERGLMNKVAQQLNVTPRRVTEFRKAVQVKCRTKFVERQPKVVVPRGLSPEEWKFSYAAIKETLIRLIVVFGLGGMDPEPAVTSPQIKSEGQVDQERRPRRQVARKRVPFSVFGEKTVVERDSEGEAEEVTDNDDDEVPPSPLSEYAAEEDPDWEEELISPVVSNAASSDSENDEDDEDPLADSQSGNDDDGDPLAGSGSDFDGEPRLKKPRRVYKPRDKAIHDPMTCSHCPDKQFRGIKGLRIHMKNVHNVSSIPYPCKICGAIQNNNVEMNEHIKKMHYIGPPKKKVDTEKTTCPHCPGKTFVGFQGYRRHLKVTHRVKNLPDHPCPVSGCSFTAKTSDRLYEHRRHFHREGRDPNDLQFRDMECPQCPGEMYMGYRGLRKHMSAVHQMIPDYPCADEGCSFVAKDGNEMWRHRVEVHRSLPASHRNPKRKPPSGTKDRECDVCSEIFSTVALLHEHRRTHFDPTKDLPKRRHKGPRPYVSNGPKRKLTEEEELEKRRKWKHCDICDEDFVTTLLLRNHMEETHEKEEDKHILCYFCTRRFAVQKTLDLHCNAAHTHFSSKIFECDAEFCEEGFKMWEELHAHLQGHVKNEDNSAKEIYYCPDCGWGTLVPQMVSIHQLNHLERIATTGGYQCPKCVCIFERLGLLRRHYKMKHEDHFSNPCPVCDENCFSRLSLTRHIRQMHPDCKKEIKLPCEEPNCEQVFSNIRHASEHATEAHGITPEFTCEECEKKFPWASLLELHVQVHENRQLECHICKKTYKWQITLERHLSVDHEKEDDPEGHIECSEEDCDKKFVTLNLMKHHLKRVHNKGQEFMCQECGRVFNRKDILNTHMKVHSENFGIECEICHKLFRRHITLKYHKQRVHNKNRVMEQHMCQECGKTYTSDTGLKFHIQSKHTPDSEKRFPCPYCPKKYHRAMLLRQHLENCRKKNGGGEKSEVELNLPAVRLSWKRKAHLKRPPKEKAGGGEEEEVEDDEEERREVKPNTSGDSRNNASFQYPQQALRVTMDEDETPVPDQSQ